MAVELIVWPGFTVRLLIAANTGAAFTSLTMLANVFVALKLLVHPDAIEALAGSVCHDDCSVVVRSAGQRLP